MGEGQFLGIGFETTGLNPETLKDRPGGMGGGGSGRGGPPQAGGGMPPGGGGPPAVAHLVCRVEDGNPNH